MWSEIDNAIPPLFLPMLHTCPILRTNRRTIPCTVCIQLKALKGGFFLLRTPITTVSQHISEKISWKWTGKPLCAGNRTQNYKAIRPQNRTCRWPLRGRLHGAFFKSVKPFVASDKPFVAEACPPMLHASASNGLSDIETHIKNASCNRPLWQFVHKIARVDGP
jgi:hypothetical protein